MFRIEGVYDSRKFSLALYSKRGNAYTLAFLLRELC